MLSLYTLKSSQDALEYYQQGDYYTKETDQYSLWLGKGAEKLALQGPVNFAVFSALLEGRLPNNELMLSVKKGEYHRPGYDLTFSAPKSVSLLALVLNDKAVLTAHREAVQETLSQIEAKYAGCRNKKHGITHIERTQNFIIAAFEHVDSRAGDPLLHTHCVLLNITQDIEGLWRAIYGDELYTDKLLNGLEYRSRLAIKLMRLGFELEIGQNGLFEIKGIKRELIDFYSKRRADIKACLQEYQQTGGKAAALANFITRPAKVSVDPEQRQERWLRELQTFGSLEELKLIVKEAKERGPVEPPDASLIASQAIQSAMNHLTERNSTFSIKTLIKTAKALSLLSTNEGELLATIEQNLADKNLLYLENKLLTTAQLQTAEQQTIERMRLTKNSVNKIAPKWIANLLTAFKTKDTKEREALAALLVSKDRQVVLSSNSKELLNRVIKEYCEITRAQHFYPRILTQNKIQVASLKKKLGTERVHTIESFLLACLHRAEKRGEPKHILRAWDRRIKKQTARDIWVVNGELSTQQLNELGAWAEHLGARLVFTQLKPIPALERLKENGLAEIELYATKGNIAKLKTQEQLLEHVEHLNKNHLIQQNEDTEKRQQWAVEQYLSTPQINKRLITLSHSERMTLNTLIRQKLQQRESLTGPAQWLTVLRPLNMSREEKSQAHLYQPGDIIRFNRALPHSQITQGSYFAVHKVDLEHRIIELWNKDTQILWEVGQDKAFLRQVEVFKPEQREIRAGDILYWNRTIKDETNPALDRIKGQTTSVVAVNPGAVLIRLQNGVEVTLNQTLQDQHWDYGYSLHLKEAEVSSVKEMTILLQNKQLDAKNVQLLGSLLEIAQQEAVQIKIICNEAEALKGTIAANGYPAPQLDNPLEAEYQRPEALSDYQTLATQLLFNRLQSEFLKVNLLNPEFESPPSSPLPLKMTPDLRMAVEVVDKVCVHHAEREAALSLEQLKKDAIQLGALLVPIEALEKAFDLAIDRSWLIAIGENEQGEKLVTAKHTLRMEQLCIEKMKAGQNQLIPILAKDPSPIQEIKNHPRLTQGQKEAIQLVLTSSDRMVAVQGIAGAGKTTALKEINRLCEQSHFQALVLANTASAKNQAKQVSHLPAMTTAQFLARLETKLQKEPDKAKQEFGGNRLYLVDESSLASTQDTFRLQKVIEQLEARLVWIGDFKQQGSIGAGFSFYDFLAYGINKVVMRENVRLSSATLFTAMKQAYAGDMAATLQTLKYNIEEIPDKQEALTTLASLYVCLSTDKKDPLVIIPLNKDRQFVNETIREQLKEAGRLAKQGFKLEVFVPQDKREIDKSDISRYKTTDVIRFNTHHPRMGVKAGEYAKVTQIDLKHQRLTLKIEGNQAFYWSPKDLAKPSAIEIYHQEQREFSANDKIVFKRNNETQGIFNGDTARLLKIEKGIADILLSNGKTIHLDLNQRQNQHLDHGYAVTTLVAQGKDVDLVLAYGEGPQPRTKHTQELKCGDTLILPKEQQGPGEDKTSKLVKLVKIKDAELTLVDSQEKLYQIKTEKKASWGYFPPFEQRSPKELPLSTSQQAFLIQITRGNDVILIVPNIEYFQKTLEAHQQMKRSALSYVDPNWQKLHEGVNRLVANIKGKAEAKLKNKAPPLNEKMDSSVLSSSPHKSKDSYFKSKPKFIDKDEVESRLSANLLGYASQWLGDPSSVTGREARWGNKGSFSLVLHGPRAGMWHNWETGQKGKGLISLYVNLYGTQFKEAIQELGNRLGLSPKEDVRLIKKPNLAIEQESKLRQQALEKDRQKRINQALNLYHKALPIQGTLAEKYLREHRGITGELPKDFRFLTGDRHLNTKKWIPALVAPYRDKAGKMVGIVRIYLNPDGSKYTATFIDAKGNQVKASPKANKGLSSHGAVVVQAGIIARTLWIAEGVETALSVAKAVPNQTVVASLAVQQIANVPISPETQKVVICADNDPAQSGTKQSIIKAVESFLSQGVQVFIALPPGIPEGMKKYDFNDLLKDNGIEVVQRTLEQMVEIKDTYLLKMSDSRLEADLNKIHLENKQKELSSSHLSKEPLTINEQPSAIQLEKELNKGMER